MTPQLFLIKRGCQSSLGLLGSQATPYATHLGSAGINKADKVSDAKDAVMSECSWLMMQVISMSPDFGDASPCSRVRMLV